MKLIFGFVLAITLPMSMSLGPPEHFDNTTTEWAKQNIVEKVGNIDKEKCKIIMERNGLNFTTFRHGAGHGMHSITLEEIRHFFEPDAPEENYIPVVNTNLIAEEEILFHAPLLGYDENFKTMALKVMAYFMLNDNEHFYVRGVNTLEKLTHQYHMHEIYVAAGPIYNKLKNNPPDPELCPCVNDVAGNGILSELQKWVHHQRHHFDKKCRNGAYIDKSKCPNKKNKSQGKQDLRDKTEIIKHREKMYLDDSSRQNAMNLMKVNKWTPNTLTGPEQWIPYQAMLTWSMLMEDELMNFTMFMYCKLNQPQLFM